MCCPLFGLDVGGHFQNFGLKNTFQKACSVNGYLYGFAQVLNMMRIFTKKRDMLRLGKTRFTMAFPFQDFINKNLICGRFSLEKNGLSLDLQRKHEVSKHLK